MRVLSKETGEGLARKQETAILNMYVVSIQYT